MRDSHSDPAGRYRPFPLTDGQVADLLDRRAGAGDAPRVGYGELRYAELDVDRLTAAWRGLLAHHDMLRAGVGRTGSQRVTPDVPDHDIGVVGGDIAVVGGDTALAAARAELAAAARDPYRRPLAEVRAVRTGDGWVVVVAVDALACDLRGLRALLAALHLRYTEPDRSWPAPGRTFREYHLAARAEAEAGGLAADRAYWTVLLDALPPPPELPAAASSAPARPPGRRRVALDSGQWAALTARAGAAGVEPASVVLSSYAEVVGRWSRNRSFTLTVAGLGDVRDGDPVGPYAQPVLLGVRHEPGDTFAARTRRLAAAVARDAGHRHCSGVTIVRELAARTDRAGTLPPIGYTDALGAPPLPPTASPCVAARIPGMWLECQAQEHDGGLDVRWDAREELFAPGVLDDMVDAHAALLRALAAGDAAWQAVTPIGLPAAQRARRTAYNDTAAPVPGGLLHDGAVARALRDPDRPAVIGRDETLSHGDLLYRALGVAGRLRDAGVRPGEMVAVVMEKGVEQVVGVLGVLLAGGAYLPVDATQPVARRDVVLTNAGAVAVLTQSWLPDRPWPGGLVPIAVDRVPPAPTGTPVPPDRVAPTDLAYVIYTSGSAGLPKGVMIDHRGAVNTVTDMNTRFGIGPDDRAIALASLGFDLSVWDIFGTLAAGGALVLPDSAAPADPEHWAGLIAEHGVTVWNSVPAQLQLLVDHLESAPDRRVGTLRLAWLSGDWIPVTLPDRARAVLPELSVVSLGGATEASIWSIHHPIGEVDPGWSSIPYGRPLTNQTFHVLDDDLADRPEWVAGELYIGGVGVALGYQGDADRTAEHFLVGAETGRRLYRTGDMGRFLPSGVIEFLGREDTQVKIHGHRIELAEVERALLADPTIGTAVVTVDGR